jgi:MYXO-CTERM domain-containing protein
MKRKLKKTSGTRAGVLALLLTLTGAALPQQTHAITFLMWYAQDAAIRYASFKAVLTPAQEATAYAANDALYLSEARLYPLGAIGQIFINGSSDPFETDNPAANLQLTFNYLNPATLQVGSGPQVASVMYEASLDPANPNVLTPIGSSSDSLSDFAIMWQSQGYEPLIEAIPLDSAGSPIVISGVGEDNSAVGLDGVLYSTPDSSPTSLLLGLGMVGLLGLRRRSRVATL